MSVLLYDRQCQEWPQLFRHVLFVLCSLFFKSTNFVLVLLYFRTKFRYRTKFVVCCYMNHPIMAISDIQIRNSSAIEIGKGDFN